MLSRSLRLALTFILLAALPAVALATDKKKVKTNVVKPAQTGTVSVALTGDECIALGGRVGTFALCTSGQACSFTDQNQVKHEMCVAKAK